MQFEYFLELLFEFIFSFPQMDYIRLHHNAVFLQLLMQSKKAPPGLTSRKYFHLKIYT